MFNSMKKVVQSVEKTWHHLASHAEQSSKKWDNEQNLYKRGILMNIHFLTDRVDVDTKIEALTKIGHLAYTGGPEASKCAGKSMDLIVDILSNISNSRSLRTQAARSLSEICKSHKDNAINFVKNGLSSVLGSLESTSDPRLTRWCIYTLVISSVNNIQALRMLSTSDELPKILRKYSVLSWNGWEKNYADLLLILLGYTEDV